MAGGGAGAQEFWWEQQGADRELRCFCAERRGRHTRTPGHAPAASRGYIRAVGVPGDGLLARRPAWRIGRCARSLWEVPCLEIQICMRPSSLCPVDDDFVCRHCNLSGSHCQSAPTAPAFPARGCSDAASRHDKRGRHARSPATPGITAIAECVRVWDAISPNQRARHSADAVPGTPPLRQTQPNRWERTPPRVSNQFSSGLPQLIRHKTTSPHLPVSSLYDPRAPPHPAIQPLNRPSVTAANVRVPLLPPATLVHLLLLVVCGCFRISHSVTVVVSHPCSRSDERSWLWLSTILVDTPRTHRPGPSIA